jgi:hypothetical protein
MLGKFASVIDKVFVVHCLDSVGKSFLRAINDGCPD